MPSTNDDQFANKLLVMDGRTLLQDVERIEVVRGTGASAWGANAVNGVASIVPKNAPDT